MKKIYLLLLAVPVFLIGSVSCNSNHSHEQKDELAAHIDSTVNPGDDFFIFANGKWFKEHPIPANEMGNGLWQLIQDTVNSQIRKICESSAKLKDAEKGSNKQKIGDFFYSGMDSVSLNSKGLSDLQPILNRIDAITNTDGVIMMAAYIQQVAGSPLFSLWVGQDEKISSKNAVNLWQGGLSLPDRNYYIATDARAIGIRSKFLKHLHNTFEIIGYDSAQARQAAVREMELETALAIVSRKRADTRDPFSNYHKMTLEKLMETTPHINWSLFNENIGLPEVDTVIVGQPEFFTALDGYLTDYPVADWKNYLKYQLVSGLGSYMDDKTYDEMFSFYSTALRGVTEPKPRWERVVMRTNRALGDLIGQVYVKEYLPAGTKDKLLEIGNAIRDVYAERIRDLDWMSDATKTRALQKLDGMIMKVGYPDHWKDLSSFQTDRSSYVHNVMGANKWWMQYMIAKYGQPVNRKEWSMEPQTYNAYYNPSNNEIVVPGCNIMVPGYEKKMADDAILYAIIGGSIFGHEMTHGFDDQGSKYDMAGNLNNWWTPQDSARFYARTSLIVKQYDGYVPVDSLHINGALTQGENIADLGGIMMGYQAFKKTNQYKNHVIIAGLNPDQRFFLGYALGWMINMRPEAISTQVRSDPHSPVKFRVNGPLSDMPEFYKTFGVKKGDAMWRPDSLRVQIW